MALKRPEKEDKKGTGFNESMGEQPVDAPVGFAPRIVKVPMNPNADVNPKVHEAKMEEQKQRAKSKPQVVLKKGAGWNAKDERQYQHIKDGGASERIAAATVNKQRHKEGRLLHKVKKGSDMLEVTLLKANKGPGSRGGKIVRHTKSGKPVYESAAKKQAESSEKMMQNWHDIAEGNRGHKGGDPEHHAIAAKQALHAAYFHHHAGDEVASHQAMDYANHHRAKYEKAGHVSRTTNAVAKLHGKTAHEVDHAGWQPEEHGLGHGHSVAHDADLEGKHDVAKKVRKQAHEERPGMGPGAMGWKQSAAGNSTHSVAGAHEGAYTIRHNVHGTKSHQVEHVSHEGKRTELGMHPGLDFAKNAAHNHNSDMQRGKEHTPNKEAVRAANAHAVAGAVGPGHIKKALMPSNSNGGNMSKNEVADIFKSELGASNAKPITSCVHCNHALTRDDLKKGLGPHAVAEDNDQPHSGGEPGSDVEPSRGVPGAKEHDEIAPLLKGLKGKDAGDKEEYPIHKSEMLTMGMNADDLDDGWYTITKSEMQKQAPEHLAYLVDRKERVSKSIKPTVTTLKKGEQIRKGDSPRSTTDGPHGYSPRAGGVHGPGGESLVQWSEGSDKQVADFIEKSGGFGPGTDESIRTQGRGEF